MTKDAQRPTDPMTAADAGLIASEIRQLRVEGLNTQKMIGEVSARMALIQRDQQEIKTTINLFTADLANSRLQRLGLEIDEGERERHILEERINMLNDKLQVKKSEAVGAMDTNEKMKKAAEMTYEEREKLEADKRANWWRETLQQAGRTIIITLAVSGALGLIAFLVWVFQFYVSNR